MKFLQMLFGSVKKDQQVVTGFQHESSETDNSKANTADKNYDNTISTETVSISTTSTQQIEVVEIWGD